MRSNHFNVLRNARKSVTESVTKNVRNDLISGSLFAGAFFHGYRINPENTEKYNIGVTMGIVMAVLFALFLLTGIILLILYKKKSK